MTVTFYQSSLGNCREGHSNRIAVLDKGVGRMKMTWSSRVKCNGGKWYSVLFQDYLEGEKQKGLMEGWNKERRR